MIGRSPMRLVRSSFSLALLVLALAGGLDAPGAQAPPRPEAPPAPRPRPEPAPPPANICTTELGWCQLPTLSAPLGIGCVCLTAQNQQVSGTTRYYPYQGPASPYLQPHTTPPSTIR